MLHGFEFISQKESHRKYRKNANPILTVIVPAEKKELPYGTFKSKLGQSGLPVSGFEK